MAIPALVDRVDDRARPSFVLRTSTGTLQARTLFIGGERSLSLDSVERVSFEGGTDGRYRVTVWRSGGKGSLGDARGVTGRTFQPGASGAPIERFEARFGSISGTTLDGRSWHVDLGEARDLRLRSLEVLR
jgi:hypothetical protein